MKKPVVLIAAILAVLGLGAVAAVAKETTEVPTSVTLHVTGGFGVENPDPGDRHRLFSGKVTAKKYRCQKGRTVVVSAYVPVGSDKSNARGEFKIWEQYRGSPQGPSRAESRGTLSYRAVVERRKITKNNGDKIVCEADEAILHGVPNSTWPGGQP